MSLRLSGVWITLFKKEERDRAEESKEIQLHFPECILHSFLPSPLEINDSFVSVDHTSDHTVVAVWVLEL